MGNINISDLRPAGADLFLDSESYLNDLTEREMTNTNGGGKIRVEYLWGYFYFEMEW
jgi:hypothetical protein